MQATQKKGLLLSTFDETPTRVLVRTLCMIGGERVLPGERMLPRATADQLVRDGLAEAFGTEKKTRMNAKPQGMKL
jgi:hypothetical protein